MPHDPQEISVISSAGGKLHVRFAATVRLEDSFRLLEEVRLVAMTNRADRVLLDVTAYEVRLNVMQRLQMALAVVAKLRPYRVAGVFSHATFDPLRIGETMAINRGAKLKVFTSLAEAEAWIDAKPAVKPRPSFGQT